MIEAVKKIIEHYFSEELGKGASQDIAEEICQLFPKTPDNPDGYEAKASESRLLTPFAVGYDAKKLTKSERHIFDTATKAQQDKDFKAFIQFCEANSISG